MSAETVSSLYNEWLATVPDVRAYDDAYEGALTLENLGMSLPPELRALHTVANWNRLVVDTIEERLDVTGFRLAGESSADDRLWEWWQSNNLDEESSFAHLDALVQGRAFVCVGKRDDDSDTPLITVESPANMYVDTDPRTRTVRTAVRFFDADVIGHRFRQATLYEADATSSYVYRDGVWTQTGRDEHNLRRAPVVPMVNRARITDRLGRSEMDDVMPLTAAACRALTNMQGAQELLAVPQRYVMGVTEKDFKNPDGSPKSALEAYMARIWAFANGDASAGQFPAANLDNFASAINVCAKLASALSGIPLRFFGVSSDANPASAEATRADETRLVKRAERKQRLFSGSWEDVMRLGVLMVDGPDELAATRLETVWRDASTPTWAASAQAAVQLFQAGLIPRETAWDDLGYTEQQKRKMAEQMGDDPLNRLLATVGSDVGGDDVAAVPDATGSGLTSNSVGGGIVASQSLG